MTSPARTSVSWIVFDTSVIRATAEGDSRGGIDLVALEAHRGTTPVSVSLLGVMELIQQLRGSRLSFAKWAAVAPRWHEVLDDEVPVIPVWGGLKAMLGTGGRDAAGVAADMRGMRAIWSVLRTARRPEDLRDGRRYTFEGVRRLFRTRKIEEYIADRERVWRSGFEGTVRQLGRPARASDHPLLIAGLRTAFADCDAVPELETAVAAAADFLILHGRGYERGTGYKPKRNDAMDFDLLSVLGLPATICSSDMKLVARVRALGTPGSDRVVTPAELLASLRARPR